MRTIKNRRLFAVFLFFACFFFTSCYNTETKIPDIFIPDILEEPFLQEVPAPLLMPMERVKKLAESASKRTGIRPAFLIAIFERESSLGANYGSCYLTEESIKANTGFGKDKRTDKILSRVMKPDRDIEPFLRIIEELGRDPLATPVSCPMKIGWGGAMGPAQILPSTWIIVKERAAMYLGKKTVDPWDPEDAFMAAAVHLQDLIGCLSAVYQDGVGSERHAACMYFSGKSCRKNAPFISRYGDYVIRRAERFQQELYPGSIPPAKEIHSVRSKKKAIAGKKKQARKKNIHKRATKKLKPRK